MKNSLDMMKDIVETTSRQIGDNLPSGESLITYFTVYDKKNGVSTNLFLTNQAIFLQESNELETIKKRRFDKINNIKLTTTEFYIEFINGYTIIGDVEKDLEKAKAFFNNIKTHTKIRTSSMEDLNEPVGVETKPIKKRNQFLISDRNKSYEDSGSGELVSALGDDVEYSGHIPGSKQQEEKKTNIGLIVGIVVGVLLLIGIIVGLVLIFSKPKDETPKGPTVEEVQARAEELLQYQVINNEWKDYLYDLRSIYEDISTDQTNININNIEYAYRSQLSNFEEAYPTSFQSKSSVSAIYEVAKIDEWMNTNKQSILNIFEIYDDLLDSNFRNTTKMLTLQTSLESAETEILKMQSILAEEKEGVKKALAYMKGEEYIPPKDTTGNSSNPGSGLGEVVIPTIPEDPTEPEITDPNEENSNNNGNEEDNINVGTGSDNNTTGNTGNTGNTNTGTGSGGGSSYRPGNTNEDDGFVDADAPSSSGNSKPTPSGRDDDAAYTGN